MDSVVYYMDALCTDGSEVRWAAGGGRTAGPITAGRCLHAKGAGVPARSLCLGFKSVKSAGLIVCTVYCVLISFDALCG